MSIEKNVEMESDFDNIEEDDFAAARIYCETIQAKINEEKAQALNEKKAGNNDKALYHYQKMKDYQKIKDEVH